MLAFLFFCRHKSSQFHFYTSQELSTLGLRRERFPYSDHLTKEGKEPEFR